MTQKKEESVLGFKVEYAAGPFVRFFLAEYANIIIINILKTILFFGAGGRLLPLPLIPLVLSLPLSPSLSLSCSFSLSQINK
uniref:Uncharacterized protein n=1 Tax=Ursus americanus TaxID=9643 RepID=A0A452SJP7_URSAM